MKGTLLFAACLFCFSPLQAQMAGLPLRTAYTRLPAYSRQFKDAFSFSSNTAAAATLQKFAAGIYSERRFMLKELSTYSAAAAFPTSSGTFCVKGDYSGSSLYNEAAAGLAYARKLGDRVDVGIQFNYFTVKAAGYGSASAVTVDAGVIFQVADGVQTGIQVANPNRRSLGKGGEETLPSFYSAGIGFDVSPQLFIGAEAEKIENSPLGVNAGIHYRFADKLVARAGVSSATSVYYIGFGVALKSILVHVTASFHPYLGVSPGLLLLYAAKE